MISHEVPAVVLGAGINGVGVARSLARARVPVWLLDVDDRRPEMHTRAAKSLKIGALHGQMLVDELVRLSTTRFSGSRPILLLTQEESVRTVSHHRNRLDGLYRFTLPSVETVDSLQHKYGFQRLAERFGAPIPKLVHVGAAAELPLLETLRCPVVVKPGARNAGYSSRFEKAYRVENAAECVALVHRILPVMADVVVQEWIEGPDSGIYFCLQYIHGNGQTVASFTGRKIRSWPPQVGGTASCTIAPEAHAELSGLTTRFFRDAGVTGMASMEYKRDARNGEFLMVEPTIGRTDYQEEVATLNGVNLPFAAYCAELGLPFRATPLVSRPTAWRVRLEDIQSAAAQRQRSGDGFEGTDRVADALWRASDPVPWLVQNVQRAQRRLRNRAWKKSVPGSEVARSRP